MTPVRQATHPTHTALHLLLALALALATTTACGTTGNDSPALPDLPVSLTFTGELQGDMTAATSVHGHIDGDPMPEPTTVNGSYVSPPPTKTQCANFNALAGSMPAFIANVVGDVGGRQVALSLEFDPGQEGYDNPGTPVNPTSGSMGGGHAKLFLPGEYEARQDVVGPGGEQSLVLNADRKSGTIDAWFGKLGLSDYGNFGVIHVTGNWRCG